MGLLRILGLQKTTPEQSARLFELKVSLMNVPTNNDSIKNYESKLKEYRQAVSEANRKEAEEYRLLVPVFSEMLKRARGKIEERQRVKLRQ